MTQSERKILQSLDEAVHHTKIQTLLPSVIRQVRQQLAKRTDAVMAWEPIPLPAFDRKLPKGIESAWVFILRAGSNTGAERHPNSHQRMMSFVGSGDLQTRPDLKQPWKSNLLVSDPAKSLDERWIAIPPNVWHQPVIGPTEDWVVVSFHTVPPNELIEERPDDATEGSTKQMRYLD